MGRRPKMVVQRRLKILHRVQFRALRSTQRSEVLRVSARSDQLYQLVRFLSGASVAARWPMPSVRLAHLCTLGRRSIPVARPATPLPDVTSHLAEPRSCGAAASNNVGVPNRAHAPCSYSQSATRLRASTFRHGRTTRNLSTRRE